jgi:hypothetical protein
LWPARQKTNPNSPAMNLTSPQSKFDKLRNRRLPLEKRSQFYTEEFERATPKTHYEYMVDTMQPIDPEYTDETFHQGDKVKAHLYANLARSFRVRFDFQGSVTSDTHILTYSDIDLLTLRGGFVSMDPGVTAPTPYRGKPVSELQALRTACEDILTRDFTKETVDLSSGKAIKLNGGFLSRGVDVVIANWWDTQLYKRTSLKKYRGVRIFDSKTSTRIRNMPFLHNARIDVKDQKTNTGLRKAIRLLKSLKYDADPELRISSYDVAALGYAIPQAELLVNEGEYLHLAMNINDFLKQCISNQALRDPLKVPNGTRLIFCDKGASLSDLKALQAELEKLLTLIDQEDSKPLVLLNEKISEFGFGQERAPWAETRSRRVAAMIKEGNNL